MTVNIYRNYIGDTLEATGDLADGETLTSAIGSVTITKNANVSGTITGWYHTYTGRHPYTVYHTVTWQGESYTVTVIPATGYRFLQGNLNGVWSSISSWSHPAFANRNTAWIPHSLDYVGHVDLTYDTTSSDYPDSPLDHVYGIFVGTYTHTTIYDYDDDSRDYTDTRTTTFPDPVVNVVFIPRTRLPIRNSAGTGLLRGDTTPLLLVDA